jgi:hypothetical protein
VREREVGRVMEKEVDRERGTVRGKRGRERARVMVRERD